MAWISTQANLGSGATQLVHPSSPTAQINCRQVIIQNNASNVMRLGDSTVSSTKGLVLNGSSAGSFNSGAVTIYNSYLSDFWVFGTSGDVVDIFYNT